MLSAVEMTHLLHHTAEEPSNPGTPGAGGEGTVSILQVFIQARLRSGLLIPRRGVAGLLWECRLLDVVVRNVHHGRGLC